MIIKKTFSIFIFAILVLITPPVMAQTLSPIPVGPGLNVNGIFYGQPVNVNLPQIFFKLRSLGFVWLRIQVNVAPLMQGDAAQEADLTNRLPQVLSLAKQAGLLVDISPVLEGKETTNVSEIKNEESFTAYKKILEFIASAITASGGLHALELLNEPEDCTQSGEWAQDQRRLYRDIRSRYPSLPLILTADCWSGYRTLTKLDPSEYATDSLAYFTFHFYEPQGFVSQDEPFAKGYSYCSQGVSFPPDRSERTRIEKGCSAALTASTKLNDDQKAKIESNLPNVLNEYFNTNWPQRIDTEFQSVEQWETTNRIRSGHVLLTEFGVDGTIDNSDKDRHRANESSRIAWIRMIVAAAKAHHMPWNYWALYGERAIADRADPLVIKEAVSNAITR